MERILVIDGDRERCARVTRALRRADFAVDVVRADSVGTGEFVHYEPSLVLVAQHWPALGGHMSASHLPGLFGVPTIVMGDETEEVAGIPYLEMGADAYLPWPMNTRVLLARVRSILNRFERRQRGGFEWRPMDRSYGGTAEAVPERGAILT